ncbi:hypothetical protein [Bowmanella yangjiangensis]|uniref:DUF2069 domain-containing protein n=1 Tax=Bowmanella yangjiangensis TaxID=2811230 RepID=A0ABS3CRI2_9ALTE|nr:hypothetical protein [Bowmanella yangjiangensis]MBN7819717.1 hypothetical protein [Bowmanella yangjiangensis]
MKISHIFCANLAFTCLFLVYFELNIPFLFSAMMLLFIPLRYFRMSRNGFTNAIWFLFYSATPAFIDFTMLAISPMEELVAIALIILAITYLYFFFGRFGVHRIKLEHAK